MSSPSANLFTQDNVPAPTTEYRIRTRYIWSNGTLQLPVAGVPSAMSAQNLAAEIIATNSACGAKVVEWTATRQGADPVLMDTTPKEGEVLKYFEVVTENAALIATGNEHTKTTSGVYVYHFLKPIAIVDGVMKWGAAPYDQTPLDSLVLSPSTIRSDLIP